LQIFHRAGYLSEGTGFLFEIGDNRGGLIETGKQLTVVLLESLGAGFGAVIEGLLNGLEPGGEGRVCLGFFEARPEKIVKDNETNKYRREKDESIDGHISILTYKRKKGEKGDRISFVT